jgi:hypothetical protein
MRLGARAAFFSALEQAAAARAHAVRAAERGRDPADALLASASAALGG